MANKSNEKRDILLEMYEDFNKNRITTLQLIRNDLEESYDQDKTLDLIDSISCQFKECVEDTKNWTFAGKLMWFNKEAFIMGYLQAVDLLLNKDID